MSPIWGGGFDPPPTKKVDFFSQNVKNNQHTLKILLHFFSPLDCTGFNEIFIKKEKKVDFFIYCPLSGLRVGGGGSELFLRPP